MNKYRTHNCGELTIKNVGENVKLARLDTNNKRFRGYEIYRFKR